MEKPKCALQTAQSALIWIGIAAGAFLLWQLRSAILLLLGAVLASVLLRSLSLLVSRLLHVPYGWALLFSAFVVLLCCGFCVWTFGASMIGQFGDLLMKLENGEEQLATELTKAGLKNPLLNGRGLSLSDMPVQSLLAFGLSAIEAAIIVGISAIYLAAEPELYRRGAGMLFPRHSRAKAIGVLEIVGVALRQWLLGQLVLMVLVGSGSYLALLIIGIPNPLALAILAGLTEIVPYIGPFIGGAPAVLVALGQSGFEAALLTMGAYLLLHLIEGYVAGPLLQRFFVHIPPVLVLISLFAAPLIFGIAGLLLAAPIAVVIFTAVKALYVRDTLGRVVDLPEPN